MNHLRRVLRVKRRKHERLADHADDASPVEGMDVERRLAGLLLELVRCDGGYEHGGVVILTPPMSHRELASWIVASPEAEDWYLNLWRRRGIIQTARRRVTVADAERLEGIDGLAAIHQASTLRREHPSDLIGRAPLNYSIFSTDIAGFGNRRRNDDDRRSVRDALYRILQETFEACSVPWTACYHEDRGDGTLTIVPPILSTLPLVDPLLPLLAAKLKRHNRQAGDPVRIRLRATLHVGPVFADDNGLCGHALIHAARMLDAPILKQSLATTDADLVFMASTHVYDTVIRHCAGLVDPATFQQVRFQVKESRITSWMYVARIASPLDVDHGDHATGGDRSVGGHLSHRRSG